MRLRSFISPVFVTVMLVVHVPVFVFDGRMNVAVGVLDSDEEPHTRDHEGGTGCRPETGNFAQQCPRECDRDPGGGCEQRGSPSGAEVAKGGHEEHYRKPVADEADPQGRSKRGWREPG